MYIYIYLFSLTLEDMTRFRQGIMVGRLGSELTYEWKPTHVGYRYSTYSSSPFFLLIKSIVALRDSIGSNKRTLTGH